MKLVSIAFLVATTTLSVAAFAHGGPEGHGPRGAGHFMRMDANNDGKVTRAEATAEADKMFASLDTNKDGFVTQAEADAHHADRKAEHAKRKDERFAERDANKDGKLSRQEVSKMPEERFKAIDTNKDGFLTKAEMEAGRPDHGPKGKDGKGGGFFAKADANSDGKISKEESRTILLGRFAKIDANGDGVVTKEELQAAHPRRDAKTDKAGKKHSERQAPRRTTA